MIAKVRGLSVVELIVSLALGAILTVVAAQLFGVNQRTYITQQNLSRVLDDGQLAIRFLAEDFRQAGFSGAEVALADGIVFAGPNASADIATGDRITVAYVGTEDCQGSVSAAPVQILNTYSVNDQQQLVCSGSLGGGNVILLDGVDGFRILYGVDVAAGDGPDGPVTYVSAANAAAAGRPIIAIRVALLLGVDSTSLPDNEARDWYLLDRVVATGADKVTRRAFYSTVMMRNLDWSLL